MQAKLWLAIVLGWMCFASSRAHAQATDGSFFDARLMLGFGGDSEVEFDDPRVAGVQVPFVGAAAEVDLEPSIGVGLGFVHLLHRHFGLGATLALHSWQTEAGDAADADRNLLLDLSLLPQGVLPVSRNVDLYLSVPLGISLSFLNEIEETQLQLPGLLNVEAEVDAGVGLHVGLSIGARFALVPGAGLLAELGYRWHSVAHEARATAQATGVEAAVEADLGVSLGQLRLSVGAFF